MKRWPILIVLLYALTLLMLSAPVVMTAFGNWGKNENHLSLHDLHEFYEAWQFWLWLAILAAGQWLLLLLPIHIAERRPPARRPLKIPIIVTAFFLANLFVAGVTCILVVLFKDDGFVIYSFADRIHNAVRHFPAHGTSDWGGLISFGLVLAVCWLIWGFIFRRYARPDDPETMLNRSTRWLLRGSILELLIAVPSHVLVRRRDDCCAPIGTFWGIATGISVMLLCFGPGVFFLFAKRMRQLRPKGTISSVLPED